MDIVSVKFQEEILKALDTAISDHNFNSRTEFIREAVREKMAALEQDRLVREFLKSREKRSRPIQMEDIAKTREKMSRDLIKHLQFRTE